MLQHEPQVNYHARWREPSILKHTAAALSSLRPLIGNGEARPRFDEGRPGGRLAELVSSFA